MPSVTHPRSHSYSVRFFFQILAIFVLACGSFRPGHPVNAEAGVTRYVDPVGGKDTANDCTQSATPCKTIVRALSVANNSGDTISLAAGVYKEHALQIQKSVSITFPGPYIFCLPPLVCTATIDGQNADRVFDISNQNLTVSMSHIIIKNGWVESGAQGGAGILVSYTTDSLSLDSVILQNNRVHCTAGECSNRDIGAAVFNIGSLSIVNSAIKNNQSDYYGGGIVSYGPFLSIVNTRITGNVATGGGAGGLDVVGSNTSLNQVTVDGNKALEGGGIFSNVNTANASFVMTNSTISNNQATNGDGGALELFGLFTLANVTISDNQANGVGQWGGFYLASKAQGDFDHVTVAGNSPYAGGGVANVGLRISNSILAGNTATHQTCQFSNLALIYSQGRNILTDTTCLPAAENIVTQDPKLGLLDVNGGPTMTRALLAGSPAIDAAILVNSPVEPASDQRGFARQGAAADSGAFERLAPAGVTASFQPANSQPGQTVDLAITLSNPNNAPALLDGLTFTMILPAGLTVAGVPTDPPNPCSGSLDALINGSTINFSGDLEAVTPPPRVCEIHIQVKAAAVGRFTAVIPPIIFTTTDALTVQASAILTVNYQIYLPNVSR